MFRHAIENCWGRDGRKPFFNRKSEEKIKIIVDKKMFFTLTFCIVKKLSHLRCEIILW